MLAGVATRANGVMNESPMFEDALVAEPSFILMLNAFLFSFSTLNALLKNVN